jgi:hypothetical protein
MLESIANVSKQNFEGFDLAASRLAFSNLQQKESILISKPISCHVDVKEMSNINVLKIFINFKILGPVIETEQTTIYSYKHRIILKLQDLI